VKVTVIGAGNVGASCADYLAQRNFLSEIVLLDVKENVAEGKAMDLNQTAVYNQFYTTIIGVTDDYAVSAGSDVVVITSGIARKPGMTREELLATNAAIVKSVVMQAYAQSPEAIFIIVANPLDAMTYLAFKTLKIARGRVFGMGGALDSARFKYYLSQALAKSAADISALVVGAHSDTGMIPLIRWATYNGVPVSNYLSLQQMEDVVQRTKVGGATLTQLLGTSAWFGPGAAVAHVVQSIMCDHCIIVPSSIYLDGEYGLNDVCIGVPCLIGRNGIEHIQEIGLNDDEMLQMSQVAQELKQLNALLN
jgi:malate dehydrogenase